MIFAPTLKRTTSLFLFLLLIGGYALPASSASLVEGTISLDDSTRDRCLKILREGLRSDEFWPSMHAAEALTLAGQGEEVRTFIAPLIDSETDAQHLCGLAREMVRAGDRSKVANLLGVLASKDPYGHVHACESIYKVNEVGDGALLRKALKQTENTSMALMAAGALARWGNPAAFSLLREKVRDEDPDTARIAAWVLGRVGDGSDVPALRDRAVRSADPTVGAYLDHALAALGNAEGMSALVKNLESDDAGIRTAAATFAGDARAFEAKDKLLALLDDEIFDVRIRAAQSLLVLSQPAPIDRDEDVSRDVFPASEKNPRYSEGSLIQLRDGSLLYATTEFIGDDSDFAKARIVAKTSADGGRSWGPSRVLQENVGNLNVMSVTLRRLTDPAEGDAPIGLFYLQKNSRSDLKVCLRVSEDEGKTFGEPAVVTEDDGYHVMNNDRVTRLSTGRLLAPCSSTADAAQVNHYKASCFLSDDAGKTWRAGKGSVDYPERGAMEPEVLELDDGRVLMIFRTQLGHVAAALSEDGGDTFGEPQDWNVVAPEAPSTLRRIPSTGDLLLVWNDTFVDGAGHGGKRTPLTAAISTDEGISWQAKRNLETNPDETYAYTSVTFANGRVLLTYYVRDEESGNISSRFRSLPIAWFYEGEMGGERIDVPDPATVLDTLVPGHPRLMLLDDDLRRLKESYDSDPALRRCVADTLKRADGFLDDPDLEHKLVGPRLLSVSRLCLKRIHALGMAWRWTEDKKYAEKAEQNLLAVCAFPDWNPSHFLDTAEMSHAVGVGYDWLYSYLDEESRSTIHEGLIELGLKPGMKLYEDQKWSVTTAFNWNQVCNGGLIAGSLAVAETAPEYAKAIVPEAVRLLPNALRTYNPDGVWTEGPSYWHYATRYTAYGLSALTSALGTDFGLSTVEGLSQTGMFPIRMTGPTGLFLNYADSGERGRRKTLPCLFWLAGVYEDSFLSDEEHAMIERHGASPEHLVWYRPPSGKEHNTLPLDHYFRSDVDAAVFRSAWDDPNALFVGVKGGFNLVNHGHLDLGNFEMDALGVRWARDLGSDNYNLPGYWDKKQGGKRWSYYRLNSYSHSVPTLDGKNQLAAGKAVVLKKDVNTTRPHIVLDLSSAYAELASVVHRGVAVVDDRRSVLVQDEFTLGAPREILWAMTTDAEIETTEAGTALLKLEGKELRARILAPEGAKFTVESAEQEPPQKTNKGVRRLTVQLPDAEGEVRVAVLLAPVWPEGGGAAETSVIPLAEW